MSRPRLYVDEDASQSIVVDGLINAGFDVLTAIQARRRGFPDEQQLQFAIADGRVIYSLNPSDFYRLHCETLATGGAHCGIVVITSQRFGPGEKLRRLRALLETISAEAMVNQVHFL